MTFTLPKFIHKPLSLLGEASYSVYLNHPIVYYLLVRVNYDSYNLHILEKLFVPILATLVVLSYFIYQYFEKYFMKLGRTTKNNLT